MTIELCIRASKLREPKPTAVSQCPGCCLQVSSHDDDDDDNEDDDDEDDDDNDDDDDYNGGDYGSGFADFPFPFS